MKRVNLTVVRSGLDRLDRLAARIRAGTAPEVDVDRVTRWHEGDLTERTDDEREAGSGEDSRELVGEGGSAGRSRER